MAESFQYDVFLSYSHKDKAKVCSLAKRLRNAGLNVWFDEEVVRPGSNFSAQIEKGLEQSRVMVLCMSANALRSDWIKREYDTFSRFRDPLNMDRRFIPLRLDDTEIPKFLNQFQYLDWRLNQRKHSFPLLVDACRPKPPALSPEAQTTQEKLVEKIIETGHTRAVSRVAWSLDGMRALSGADDNILRLWDFDTGRCLRVFEGHSDWVLSVALSPDGKYALSGARDKTLRLWDVNTGHCLRVFEGHSNWVLSVALSPDGRHALSGAMDRTLRLWDIDTGRCLRVFKGYSSFVLNVAWSPNGRYALSSDNDTLRLWDVDTGRCLRVFQNHFKRVLSIAWGPDSRYALSGAKDKTLHLWDVDTGRCLRVFEGHSDWVLSVAWSPDGRLALSGSQDNTLRLWDVDTGRCLHVLEGHSNSVWSVAWSASGTHAFSAAIGGVVRIWDLSDYVAGKAHAENVSATPSPLPESPPQVEYKSAKVLLVGESGAGKTGLSHRLAENKWKNTDSTIGAWATQWQLPVNSTNPNLQQEIWLWDFGGQADQRLIHQLFMNDTAVAVLVFDGQKRDLLETLEQWVYDLTYAASFDGFKKLLVAGRVDAGGLTISRKAIDDFVEEHKFEKYLPTSARTGENCQELGEAIQAIIPWKDLPAITTEALFKRLKDEIIRLKDAGKVLMDLKQLHNELQYKMEEQFHLETLQAVLTSLAGPGMVQVLGFGNLVLLKPEYINAYAQAVIRTIREDPLEFGCLLEERVLKGDLRYESSLSRLEDKKNEKTVLEAMCLMFVERKLCLKRQTYRGAMLIFPSYYRRERPPSPEHPKVLMSFQFKGVLDYVYCSLVVQMHHMEMVKKLDEQETLPLWRGVAEFKMMNEKRVGIELVRLKQPGEGRIDVYFDSDISIDSKATFCKYIEGCLEALQNERYIVPGEEAIKRLRHYICPECGWTREPLDVAKRLDESRKNPNAKKYITCSECEKDISLWDELEEWLVSEKTREDVRALQDKADETFEKLSNESKEHLLISEVKNAVARAGQIAHDVVRDNGIDMEIEFRYDNGHAAVKRLYLQLKSGNSYLRERRVDDAEIFQIKNPRHVKYWMDHYPDPVMLVIRNSQGQIRWMEISEYLRRESDNGQKPVTQIRFDGKPFHVDSILAWRKKVLQS